MSDGYSIVALPAAQDHKRIGEGDTGSNTGGMGAYAPAPVATPAILDRILKESLRPTIDGMRKEGQALRFCSEVLTDCNLNRIPIPRITIHRFHVDPRRAQSSRI